MADSKLLQKNVDSVRVQIHSEHRFLSRSGSLLLLAVLVLFALACWMRWHTLGVSFDRNSYDEGVYWQSLRSIAAGNTLYAQIFYSQPPAFLLSIFPFYLAFGQSLLAARIGIALLSLCGLLGALFVGKVLRGNSGALVALILLLINPLYLLESQILQADAPSTALMVLAVGFAYLWWKYPTGWPGYGLAIATTITLVLSILSKLFGLADLAPIGLLAVAHLWRVRQQPAHKRLAYSGSLLVGIGALLLTCLLFLVPFSGSFSQLWDQVITFHSAAATHTVATHIGNIRPLINALLTPLGIFAFYGTVVSLARRDWRVLPLIAWLLAILYLLFRQLPLFDHHLVILVPPLVLLATMSLGPFPVVSMPQRLRLYLGNGLTIIAMCVVIINFLPGIIGGYQAAEQQINTEGAHKNIQVIHELDQVTTPGQLVVTDAQFLAAEAARNTPPQLVDTSGVRIQSGYLSDTQLIQITGQPSVHAVLFYTKRLIHEQVFYHWVGQNLHMVHNYGNGQELWVK